MSAETSDAEPEIGVGSPSAPKIGAGSSSGPNLDAGSPSAPPAQEDSSIGAAAAAASAVVQALGEFASLPPPTPTWPVGGEGEGDSELDDDYEQLQVEDLLDSSLHVKANVEALLRRLLIPQRVLLQDKLTFVLFFFNLLLCSYLLGYSPQRFYRLYTVEAGVLLIVRFITYKWSLQHYYLLDWCYVSNALLVAWIYCFPRSVMLFKICFAHAMGPLLWSILAFRNSIVPHSLDKMTSHFMHWYPACVCWASRWHPTDEMAAHLESNPAERERWESAGVLDLVVLPLLPYLLWATFYFVKVFVVSSSKIQERGYATLFNFSTASRRSLFGAVVLRAPLKLRPLVYMTVHLLLTSLTMLANLIWFKSYWATTAFLVCILAASLWSGANFYEYLAKKGSRRVDSILSSGTQQPSQSVTVDSKKRS